MNQLRKVAARWLPLIIWMTLIFLVSNQPKTSIPSYGPWDLYIKKGGHMLAYGVLAVLARRTQLNDVSAFALVAAYAVSDELHQHFVPGRMGTVIDVFIDLLGAALSYLLLRPLPLRWREALLGQTGMTDAPSPRDA